MALGVRLALISVSARVANSRIGPPCVRNDSLFMIFDTGRFGSIAVFGQASIFGVPRAMRPTPAGAPEVLGHALVGDFAQ